MQCRRTGDTRVESNLAHHQHGHAGDEQLRLGQEHHVQYSSSQASGHVGFTAEIIAHHCVLDEGVHCLRKTFAMKDLGPTDRLLWQLIEWRVDIHLESIVFIKTLKT